MQSSSWPTAEIIYYPQPEKITADHSLESMLIGLQALCFQTVFNQTGQIHEDPNQPIVIEGRSSGFEMAFISAKALDLVTAGLSLSAVPLNFRSCRSDGTQNPQTGNTAIKRYVNSFFATYAMAFYEQHKQLFWERYGRKNSSRWPVCARLLWMIRNHHAHNGDLRQWTEALPMYWRALSLVDGSSAALTNHFAGPDYFILCRDTLDELLREQAPQEGAH